MRKLAVALIAAAALGSVLAASASASGPVTITSVTATNRHVAVNWVGPFLEFGAVQIATHPETGSDGNFFAENRVRFDLIAEGQTSWLDSYQIEHPGTYYLRVDGWDPQCTFYDYGYGITGWLGCDTYSNIVQFTIAPICKRTLLRRGYWTYRSGKRIWHKPTYRTVCS